MIDDTLNSISLSTKDAGKNKKKEQSFDARNHGQKNECKKKV